MPKKSVLIIDDQRGIRALLLEFFSMFGFTVLEARDGLEGIDLLQSNSPDLILLDMKMPGLSGMDTLREVRRQGITIPVVLITAYQDSESIIESERLGVVARLTKPFDLEDLQSIIRGMSPARLQVASA